MQSNVYSVLTIKTTTEPTEYNLVVLFAEDRLVTVPSLTAVEASPGFYAERGSSLCVDSIACWKALISIVPH